MQQVKEESPLWITVSFFDKNGEDATPDSINYRIDTENEEVRGDTPFTPASTIEIMIGSSENKIVTGFPSEIRIVTITASFGADDKQNIEVEYEILNLRKIQ